MWFIVDSIEHLFDSSFKEFFSIFDYLSRLVISEITRLKQGG